jgi:hypothetical protein
MNIETTYDVIGVLGAILILLGFYRTSIGRWTNRSFIYELDNLVGASLLASYQLHHHAYITVIVNVIWAIIAFRGITSFAERRHKPAKKTRRKAR